VPPVARGGRRPPGGARPGRPRRAVPGETSAPAGEGHAANRRGAAGRAAALLSGPLAFGAALLVPLVLPVSTPPNAIIYGSGLVPLREMVRAGLWLDVTGAALIWVGLRLLCPLLGLG
jgi:hypothetical protein